MNQASIKIEGEGRGEEGRGRGEGEERRGEGGERGGDGREGCSYIRQRGKGRGEKEGAILDT